MYVYIKLCIKTLEINFAKWYRQSNKSGTSDLYHLPRMIFWGHKLNSPGSKLKPQYIPCWINCYSWRTDCWKIPQHFFSIMLGNGSGKDRSSRLIATCKVKYLCFIKPSQVDHQSVLFFRSYLHPYIISLRRTRFIFVYQNGALLCTLLCRCVCPSASQAYRNCDTR
mgnify:CR=1 FL=1